MTPVKATKEQPKEESNAEEKSNLKDDIKQEEPSETNGSDDKPIEEEELILKDECTEDLDLTDKEQTDDSQNIQHTISQSEIIDELNESKEDNSIIDNEDSINLTIGEEDEQMFHDEDDVKPKGNSLNKIFYFGDGTNILKIAVINKKMHTKEQEITETPIIDTVDDEKEKQSSATTDKKSERYF